MLKPVLWNQPVLSNEGKVLWTMLHNIVLNTASITLEIWEIFRENKQLDAKDIVN